MQDDTRKTIWRRLGLIAVVLPICFIFPIALIFVGFLAWTIYEDLKPSQYPHVPPPRTWRDAKPEDSDWLVLFCNKCESPAETAFFEAMINAYGLVPDKGMLQGTDLTLDLQVKIPPYRVDFLINRWLVVEIDGAAYHSSPEAIKRDKARDEFMQERGYSVLRIPASVVFTTPYEAVNRVAAILSRKQPASALTLGTSTKGKNKRTSLREILSAINDAVSEINSSVATQLAIKEYTNEHAARFYAERLAIEKAIELAESEIRVNQYISQSEEHRKLYLAAFDELQGIFDSKAQHNQTAGTARFGATISIPPPPKDEVHPDPNINQAIVHARQVILSERENFFDSIRHKLNNDKFLKGLVREKLNEFGCGECWQYVSQ